MWTCGNVGSALGANSNALKSIGSLGSLLTGTTTPAAPAAGLSVPVRIEGPLANPSIKPEIKAMFANPEQAGAIDQQLTDVVIRQCTGDAVIAPQLRGLMRGRVIDNQTHAERG